VVDQLRHLEHRDAALATEHRAQLVVGVDLPTVLLVLEAVLLDVVPDPRRDLGARHRAGPDDGAELRARLQGLHDRGVRGPAAALRGALRGARLGRATLRRALGRTALR